LRIESRIEKLRRGGSSQKKKVLKGVKLSLRSRCHETERGVVGRLEEFKSWKASIEED
jgi:hypothetical protein